MWTLFLLLALATPPDVWNNQVTVLCTGDAHVGMLVASTGNAGSHYVRTTQLDLVRLDVGSGALDVVPHGSEKAAYIHLDEPERGPDRTRAYPDTASPLLEQLHGWGLDECFRHSEDYGIRAELPVGKTLELQLSLEGERRTVPVTVWDPRGTSWRSDTRNKARTLEGLADHAHTTVGAPLLLKQHVVLPARIDSGMGTFDAFVVAERAAFVRAEALLLNQKGLGLHRAGEHAEAGAAFGRAANVDPTFSTAVFNLACTQARRGQVSTVVQTLKRMPPEGLAKRLAADADFDGIRGDEVFESFVRDLPGG